MFRAFILSITVLAGLAYADLAAVLKEPDLERRSELALENALTSIEAARTAYNAGNDDGFKKSLAEVQESAELSYKSLQDTGKPARKKPKYFKRAEQKLRLITRKLEALEQEVNFEYRASVDPVEKRVHDLHDQVLTDIMTKKN